MGQKVNPIGFRTGVMRTWTSRWFASKQDFSSLLLEDQKLRRYLKQDAMNGKLRMAGIDHIEIERTRDEVKVVLHVARPGTVIGKKGEQIDALQVDLQNLIGRRVNLKIQEVSRPEIQAQIIAE
ncbi:MAG TPA: 30S ribosomal protein S3, partial [Pirellulaceae bacterium]